MRAPRGASICQQAGQALPLVLVFLLVLCIGALATFNTGQVVNKKVEITNTADAAAYSVAVEQARAWNMAAYLNRGRVANEVAVAQLVSLNSWVRQINVTLKMLETYMNILSAFPPLATIAQPIARISGAADRALRGPRKILLQVSRATVQFALDPANGIYASAARTIVSEVGGIDRYKVAEKVVGDNSPQASISTASKALLVGELTSAYRRDLEHLDLPGRNQANRETRGGERYRNIIMASRDAFSRDRRDSWMLAGVIGLYADGGTDMVNYGRWASIDTNQLRVKLWTLKIDVPLGWAGQQAVRGANDGTNKAYYPGIKNGRGWTSPYTGRRMQPYNGIRRSEIAAYLASIDPYGSMVGGSRNDQFLEHYNGLVDRDYDDVNARRNTSPDDGPVFTVEVEVPPAVARTSDRVGIGTGRMQAPASNRNIRAVASSQVYFNRPTRVAQFARKIFNGRQTAELEMGSLFSPYWQARLVETPRKTRLLLAAAGTR